MSKNILIVESDFETSRIAAKALEGEGYFVFISSTAEAGLMMAKRVKPSLILLDLSVKGVGGVEFTAKLREAPAVKDSPILLFASAGREYDPALRERYGIVNFLKLPVDTAEVVQKSKASLEGIPRFEDERPPVAEKTVLEQMLKRSEEQAMGAEEKSGPHPVAEKTGPEPERPGPAEPDIGPLIRDELTNNKEDEAFSMNRSPIEMDFRKERKPKKTLFMVILLVLFGAISSFGYFMLFMHPKAEAVREDVPQSAAVDSNGTSQANALAQANAVSNAVSPDMAASNASAAGNAASQEAAPVASAAPNPAPQAAADKEVGPARDKKSVKTAKAEEKIPARAGAAMKAPGPEKTALKKTEGAQVRIPGSRHLYALQVGVFSKKANAEKTLKSLKAKGFMGYVKSVRARNRTVYRVLVGRYNNPRKADAMYKKLKKQGFRPIHYSG